MKKGKIGKNEQRKLKGKEKYGGRTENKVR